MRRSHPTHLLLDFFGTLVDYSASRTEQDYAPTYELLRNLGATVSYDEFLARLEAAFDAFDRRSARDDREYSMQEPCGAFLAEVLPAAPTAAEVEAFIERYLTDWNTGVHYPPGIADLVAELRGGYRLAVVTNTHRATLVPEHLRRMGIRSQFDAVITSVEVGWRKPHPEVYAAALDALGIGPTAAIFVGDTYGPDYHGPRWVGIPALLIDPRDRAPVPDIDRLGSIFELPARLNRW